MSDHVYKSSEFTGSARDSITAAIDNAVKKASESVTNMDWFEVEDIRGVIADGAVDYYQVTVKIGHRLS